MILRFLVLFFESHTYERPMNDFLNGFMGRNRWLQTYHNDQIRDSFESTITVVRQNLSDVAFKPRGAFVAALYDAVMVGTARRLQQAEITGAARYKKRFQELVANWDFVAATSSHTSDEANVAKRIDMATQAFAAV